jgi:CoA transferase family III
VRPDGSELPLFGKRLLVAGTGLAASYACGLLRDLGGGVEAEGPLQRPPQHDWATSGAMALTGRFQGPPRLAPGGPATAVRGALLALDSLAAASGRWTGALPGPQLLGERAATAGLGRRGPLSVGGSFRFLRTTDGWLGLSLARPDDVALVPALVEVASAGDPWSAVAAWAAAVPARAAAERAGLLGLAAAALPERPAEADEQLVHRGAHWVLVTAGPPRHARRRPLVLDLTSLWAGPLCAHLLSLTGCRVIKVESTSRPDGARRGPRHFYDLLHAGTQSVALDLASRTGVDRLRRLVDAADLVLEGSRPRALEQLGVRAADAVSGGTSWLSITAYGRTGPWSSRVGFGDDVAAAGGLIVREDDGQPLPCGDALADPLTGVHAAVAAAAALLAPRAHLLDVSMRDVAAEASALPVPAAAVVRRHDRHVLVDEAGAVEVAAPSARRRAGTAPQLGHHTSAVLGELCS